MANLAYIQEDQLINAPSINLLPHFAMFNDSFTWNVVSGTATATNLNQNQLEGERCLRVVPSYSTGAVVNSGDTQMQVTIGFDGNYVFSIKHQCNIPSLTSMQVSVKIYVNAVLTDYDFTASATYNDQYRTYYQVIPDLIFGDVIDFAFEFGTSDGAGTYKHYFDAPKFEFDNFGLGLPTVFSLPQTTTIEVTETVDVPSIASNDFETVAITVTGAEVGDYVQMTYPVELITLGLIVSYPIVTATDEVSFIIHNHSGGAIDPASGDYSFKIVK
jgi:hypothetical protein